MENPFKNLFKKSGQSVLGVDIGPSSIKLVQLRKDKGRAILETYGALALGPYAGVEVGRATHLPPQKVAEALIDLVREANATTKQAGVSISMSSSLISLMEVPSIDQKQIEQMIPLEARKYIPVPVSEVSLDWWVLPKEDKIFSEEDTNASVGIMPVTPAKTGGEKTQVLLVAIHNDALNDMREIIKLSSLESSFFEIEIFSTIRAVLDGEIEPVMIFDMGASSTKLYIVERGILKTSHIIDRGSQDLSLIIAKSMGISVEEAENLKRTKGLEIGAGNKDLQGIMLSTLDYIFSESNRLLLNYQKKNNKNISKVVLTGGGSGLRGFLTLARESFQIEVTPADPFSKVDAPAFLANILKQAGPEFAVSVGLALRKLQETD